MNLQQLTTSELLVKEMSEIRANQLAKQLIEERKEVDASQNIAFVMAKVLTLVKPAELQKEIYTLLIEASAASSSDQAKLSAAVRRTQELAKEVEELKENQPEMVDFIEEVTEEEAFAAMEESKEHEPS